MLQQVLGTWSLVGILAQTLQDEVLCCVRCTAPLHMHLVFHNALQGGPSSQNLSAQCSICKSPVA